MNLAGAYTGGLQIYVQEPRIEPKIKLKAGLCSPAFELEMQAWLTSTFGVVDLTLLKRGQTIVSPLYGFAVMRREDFVRISGLS